jgi:hypothetical protein
MKSHSHYFASIHTAWENLPESMAERYPTAEHLRKWSLVQAGYAAETDYAMDTPADARKMAAAIRKADEYAVIKVSGNAGDEERRVQGQQAKGARHHHRP